MYGRIGDMSRRLKQQKLEEVRGRARREVARCCKSEWKVYLAIRNSSRSNGRWQIIPKTVSFLSQNHVAYGLASAYSVRALRVGQYARYNVFVCGLFFRQTQEELP